MSTIEAVQLLARTIGTMQAETQADVDAENAIWQSLYEHFDDELDWLGEWRGRKA